MHHGETSVVNTDLHDHPSIPQPVCLHYQPTAELMLAAIMNLTIDASTFETKPLLYRLCVIVLQIPLVGVADELEAHLLECLDKRATVGPAALPSAAFYTFVNSHHTLNCVTSSSDGACVAGQSARSLGARSACVVTDLRGSASCSVIACAAGQHDQPLQVALPARCSLLVCPVTMCHPGSGPS